MDIIYVLVPLSLLLLAIAIGIFFWAVRSGQFDDMESPAHKILFDDDEPEKPQAPDQATDDTQPRC
ncbi:cbb3-type cytochrome oxidase assembly protein CcoS [Bacterioplanoides pacificum]|uniref:Cbb3-type cytochrome oxidase assembly protein CcoS n=1 Tax=Bacterioplanoides pacificum TaxID=1171596 RepID=A0ABV7VQZ2_9GAMM